MLCMTFGQVGHALSRLGLVVYDHYRIFKFSGL